MVERLLDNHKQMAMLSVSLHGIRITAPLGLYPQELLLHNIFEVDVDVYVPGAPPWPYIDYTLIRQRVATVFGRNIHLLEHLVEQIHAGLKSDFPVAQNIRVAIRKLNPPMPGEVAYAQVCYEG